MRSPHALKAGDPLRIVPAPSADDTSGVNCRAGPSPRSGRDHVARTIGNTRSFMSGGGVDGRADACPRLGRDPRSARPRPGPRCCDRRCASASAPPSPPAIYWGPDLVLLYNDSWSEIPAERHPGCLGRPGREVWTDIWDIVAPQFVAVMETGEGFSAFDQPLPMVRERRAARHLLGLQLHGRWSTGDGQRARRAEPGPRAHRPGAGRPAPAVPPRPRGRAARPGRPRRRRGGGDARARPPTSARARVGFGEMQADDRHGPARDALHGGPRPPWRAPSTSTGSARPPSTGRGGARPCSAPT